MEYLKEPVVRQNHDLMFRQFAKLIGDRARVVDLGCGTGEYERHGSWKQYLGVDRERAESVQNFLEGDWLHPELLIDRLPFKPTAFVSIFSMELGLITTEERYRLYNALFKMLSSLRYALVAGFFYRSKREQETVAGASGIVGHQTIEDPVQFPSPTFAEFRCHIETPSGMFEPDVVEVWKILTRR